MHARFDYGFAVSLGTQAGFDRIQDLVIVERQCGYIVTAEVANRYRFTGHGRCADLHKSQTGIL